MNSRRDSSSRLEDVVRLVQHSDVGFQTFESFEVYVHLKMQTGVLGRDWIKKNI